MGTDQTLLLPTAVLKPRLYQECADKGKSASTNKDMGSWSKMVSEPGSHQQHSKLEVRDNAGNSAFPPPCPLKTTREEG